MEVNVEISVHCKSKDQFNFCKMMLSDDPEKPIFEDDVLEGQQEWFAVLDEIELPDSCKGVGGKALHLTYLFGGYTWDDEIEALLKQFASLGVSRVAAASTSEMGDGELRLFEEGRVNRYEQWKGDAVTKLLRGKKSLAQKLDALLGDD
ncbi:MAG TPA: hypothetical protein EYG20_03200 [Alcanivorax sp.]|nr:hypothetical protein [Alcanivorax sp.]